MNNFRRRGKTALLGGAVFAGSYLVSQYLFVLLLAAMLGWILYDEWPRVTGFNYASVWFWFTALLYPIPAITTLIVMVFWYRSLHLYLPLYPFVASWSFDTGSYIAGKLFGNTKLVPRVSPGKTWEGLFGGVLTLFGFHLWIVAALQADIALWKLIVSTIFVAAAALFGDLFISYLKRKQDIKDTGDVLPGHGGMLDRFDSVFFIALSMALTRLFSL